MSASRPGDMSGPRRKTPLLLLLLLLLLAGTVCQYDEPDPESGTEDNATEADPGEPEPGEPEPGEPGPDESGPPEPDPGELGPPEPESETDQSDPLGEVPGTPPAENTPFAESGSAQPEEPTDATSTSEPPDQDGLGLIIILIPVVLVVLIIAMIVFCILLNRRWIKKANKQDARKEDPYLDGSSTEKVPMPMFEEDVPSVLELEMEELDQWMKKDG